MEQKMVNFGFADSFVGQNRRQVTFLDGVQHMINWDRIENFLKAGLGRTR